MNRRDALRAVGAGALAGVAGCLNLGGSSGASFEDHEATTGIRDQPIRGDLDGHLVVAFEDPSCSRCRAFEQQTVPKLVSNLVEPGKAAYAVRSYPVVYPWGEPATHALEATFARDDAAFWDLLAYYFDEQSDFSEDNVVDRTRQFLDDETDVSGDEVATDTRNRAHAGAVQADLDAGQAADVGQTTPTVFLFKDGEYLTRASGSVSYDLIATSLGE